MDNDTVRSTSEPLAESSDADVIESTEQTIEKARQRYELDKIRMEKWKQMAEESRRQVLEEERKFEEKFKKMEEQRREENNEYMLRWEKIKKGFNERIWGSNIHQNKNDVDEVLVESDHKKVQSNVCNNDPENSKPQESLRLTEGMFEKMMLQSERKGKKKLKHSARELFLTERCLEKIRTELLEVLRNRYSTWKLENPMDNRAAVLFHYTKIENELNHFERRIIQKSLENEEEEEDAGKEEMKDMRTEKRWRTCEKNLEYHRRNQQESIDEAKTVSKNIDKILRSDEEFTIKKQKLITHLVLIVFLMFSAYNSLRELSASGEESRRRQAQAFEKFYPGVVDWIFLVLIKIEENRTNQPSDWEQAMLKHLSTFQSHLLEFSPDPDFRHVFWAI